MKKSIKKRIRLTKNVINKERVTDDKKARYEAKLAVLEGMLKQEAKEGVKFYFRKGAKQASESGYTPIKK